MPVAVTAQPFVAVKAVVVGSAVAIPAPVADEVGVKVTGHAASISPPNVPKVISTEVVWPTLPV